MNKTNLLGYSRLQMEDLMTGIGQKPYKGRQLFSWAYRMRQFDFEQMTDLSKEIRTRLQEKYEFALPSPVHAAKSSDGTRKWLFELPGKAPIETVLIPDNGRRTLCISVQSGCALACKFCATGKLGLNRDLTSGEIVGQLLFLQKELGDDAFTNIVMMGMGEPLNNYHNVVDAISLMTDQQGMCIAPRRVTVSTSGVTPKIRKLADPGIKCQLALSLHAASQAKRERIMPVARTFALKPLMEAVKYYTKKTDSKVMIEYILFRDFNDQPADVKQLAKLLRGIPCKINLIGYNPVAGLPWKRPSEEQIDWFARELNPHVAAVMVRKSRGRDIDAACGQLAAKQMES